MLVLTRFTPPGCPLRLLFFRRQTPDKSARLKVSHEGQEALHNYGPHCREHWPSPPNVLAEQKGTSGSGAWVYAPIKAFGGQAVLNWASRGVALELSLDEPGEGCSLSWTPPSSTPRPGSILPTGSQMLLARAVSPDSLGLCKWVFPNEEVLVLVLVFAFQPKQGFPRRAENPGVFVKMVGAPFGRYVNGIQKGTTCFRGTFF